jgi:hypothetical protein
MMPASTSFYHALLALERLELCRADGRFLRRHLGGPVQGVARGALQLAQAPERLLGARQICVDTFDLREGPHSLDVQLSEFERGRGDHLTGRG